MCIAGIRRRSRSRSSPVILTGPTGSRFHRTNRTLIIEAGIVPRVNPVYDVVAGGSRLSSSRTLITAEPTARPTVCLDVDGNLWCGWVWALKDSTA